MGESADADPKCRMHDCPNYVAKLPVHFEAFPDKNSAQLHFITQVARSIDRVVNYRLLGTFHFLATQRYVLVIVRTEKYVSYHITKVQTCPTASRGRLWHICFSSVLLMFT